MKAVLATLALVLGFSFSVSANAQPRTADEMTCKEAVAYYQKHNRIWVWASGQDIVPIYGPKPVAKIGELRCPIKTGPRAYFVGTLDNDECVIGYHCISN